MSNDLRANQELIDEMRAMNSVLDEYFYRVAYEHFERQTSVALWPVKIGEQAEKAKEFCGAIRAKYLQAQIGEQEAFADSLDALQAFALSFDQYTSLDQCETAASKARDCMRQVEAAGEQARLFNARELLFEREVTDYQQLSNIKKKFEPYFQLWDTSEQWLTASAAWHAQSFLTLEAEQIEADVNTCVEIKVLRRVRAESSTRRLLDGVEAHKSTWRAGETSAEHRGRSTRSERPQIWTRDHP